MVVKKINYFLQNPKFYIALTMPTARSYTEAEESAQNLMRLFQDKYWYNSFVYIWVFSEEKLLLKFCVRLTNFQSLCHVLLILSF
jgi:hypothetical protein